MKIIPEIAESQQEIQSMRRWMHAHPELSFQEKETGDLIAKTLVGWGIQVHRGLGRTGVVGVLKVGNGNRAIGLRADMDALPIQERNDFAHRSEYPGKMHACGHDGHMAMLLGAARYLARARNFDGTVVFIFSPAEEAGSGAKVMVDEGLFERFPVDAVFGLHNEPGLPAGKFGVRVGTTMAASGEFRIRLTGVGSHAAAPHLGKDPLFVGVQVVNALQGIITRNKKPVDKAVLSVTQFEANGGATNIIPEVATIAGTVRAESTPILDLIESRMKTVVEGLCAVHDCQLDYEFARSCPPTVNTPDETRFAAEVMKSIVGEAGVDTDIELDMGVEDFAYMLQARPGAYAYLGIGTGEHRASGHGSGPCELHNASYDFNDEMLSIGSTYWAELALHWLKSST
ncbi:M20 aminoacylase family protein [Mesorhizobium sp.]|uniref:M20 aminoacylase family protein n=1 Tax=Mesorhizobium sp. TaxID=1871066 RepID=UPI000FE998EF|nr:M20 aminoacylase family protein [Mesorhizobium sp.]TGQ63421.1 amidohydrolase [bacterium M00.F.Ca.ET.205.01.1.1]TGU46606.1 amidohydrolase [bacterium M00.F.Ca.ET.152.01.1.1]TGV31694.1 amidohydrolase [Mesorhizobium sp. M00.F.Ca.ET.186.01.1.1]TGZ38877.1 amidohydrolase [bacterium M00.F.Ca.ET.162.01.1.1]RWA60766.1 MAG: amidohydrolase [Mesorhizobium sp.]